MTVRTYGSGAVAVHLGDCLDVLRALPDASVHAVVTDPPYGLEFMGKEWDGADGFRRSLNTADTSRNSVFGRASKTSPEYRTGTRADPAEGASPVGPLFQRWCHAWAKECLRVLKPGGHLLAFGGTRTYHRLTCAIEDAGFEIRDSISWLYGSGFPKSMNISKAIDKARDDRADVLRVTGEVARLRDAAGLTNRDLDALFGFSGMAGHWTSTKSQPAVPTVEQWTQLRSVLLPAEWLDAEVWRLNGRKGTPGEAWHERPEVGTGYRVRNPSDVQVAGLSTGVFTLTAAATDASRQWEGWGTTLKPAHEPVVVARRPLSGTVAANVLAHGTGGMNIDGCRVPTQEKRRSVSGRTPNAICGGGKGTSLGASEPHAEGRWPTNLLLSHSALLDEHGEPVGDACANGCAPGCAVAELDMQSGYSVSPNSTGRGAGGQHGTYSPIAAQGRVPAPGDSGGASRFFPVFRYQAKAPARERPKTSNGTAHPTVKPLALMRWLVRLVTPPGGTVLDPFAGSGTTAEACALEGFACVAAEKDPQYLPLIEARLARALPPDSTGPRCNCTHCRPKETAE